MTKNKTIKNSSSVTDYLNQITNETKRLDCFKLISIMETISQKPPFMWGDSIIGFGDITYHTKDKQEHAFFKIGFAPRKQNIALYLMIDYEQYANLFAKLGKYKHGKMCLYINKLKDIDITILTQIIQIAFNNSNAI